MADQPFFDGGGRIKARYEFNRGPQIPPFNLGDGDKGDVLAQFNVMLSVLSFGNAVRNRFLAPIGDVLKAEINVDGQQRFLFDTPQIAGIEERNPAADQNKIGKEIVQVPQDFDQERQLPLSFRQASLPFLSGF